MIIALPFDLRLWTGVQDEASTSDIYSQFVVRRDLVYSINEMLSQDTIPHCRLRIPLTQRLFEQLSTTPPWTEIRKGSLRHRLKRTVLSVLRNKRDAAGLTLYVDPRDVEHLHVWRKPDGFFAPALTGMREGWVEIVGICVFEDTISARDFEQPMPILGACVITAFSEASEAQIVRRSLADMTVEEEGRILLLFQSDPWTWKRWVRRVIWADERLPLGPISYSPPSDWQLGNRPRRYRGAYRDSLGGLWEWESGRASDEERNPFAGHWDIQFPNPSIKHQWVQWIEKCTGWRITTRPTDITHINVEPDGTITDKTFTYTTVTNDA